MSDQFTLREMQSEDSAGIANLITEPDSDMTSRFVLDAYTVMVKQDTRQTVGVVAETNEFDGLVGLATVTFGTMRFEGEVLPYALLASLKVHEQFRKRGLGSRLARWRIDRAREAFGEQGVIITGMQSTNDASRGTATKWCRDFFEPLQVAPVPLRKRPPQPLAGITIREARTEDYEEIVEKQNQFYADYNLYEPVTAESLAEIVRYSPIDTPINQYFVAVNAGGDIMAGAKVRNQGQLIVDQLNNPPTPIRLLNPILRLFPPDFVLRMAGLTNLWFVSGQEAAASYLWQSIRYLNRDSANVFAVNYDPRGPIEPILELKPWNQPRPQVTYALHGPVPLNQEKLVFVADRR